MDVFLALSFFVSELLSTFCFSCFSIFARSSLISLSRASSSFISSVRALITSFLILISLLTISSLLSKSSTIFLRTFSSSADLSSSDIPSISEILTDSSKNLLSKSFLMLSNSSLLYFSRVDSLFLSLPSACENPDCCLVRSTISLTYELKISFSMPSRCALFFFLELRIPILYLASVFNMVNAEICCLITGRFLSAASFIFLFLAANAAASSVLSDLLPSASRRFIFCASVSSFSISLSIVSNSACSISFLLSSSEIFFISSLISRRLLAKSFCSFDSFTTLCLLCSLRASSASVFFFSICSDNQPFCATNSL